MAVGGQLQRYFVLVVVVLDVSAQAQEYGQLTALQLCGVVDECFGVCPHLQAAIVAQVEHGVAVYSAGVSGIEVGDFKHHGLLVELRYLALSGVDDTCHTGRQNVVDGFARGVFFDVDYGDVQLTLGGRIAALIEVEVVAAPLAAYQLQGGETQVGGALEPGHKDTGKAYGGEVGDAAHDFFVVGQGYLELIPLGFVVFAVAAAHHGCLLVGDVVLTHDKVLRTYGYAILEVTFVLVERIVLVDVLDVGDRT